MADSNPRRVAVTAPDGIEIVGAASGAGPALALVYGAMMEQTGWARLVPYLLQSRGTPPKPPLKGDTLAGDPTRTVYTYDRRGRGESGSTPQATVQNEVDDLTAFVAAIPEPRDLFAHSSGALLALLAVEQGLRVRRLVLYEPPLASMRQPALSLDLPERIEALVAQGDRDAALTLFFREGMEQLSLDIDRLREGPRWEDQMRYVQTGAYDVRITRTYEFRPERLARIDVPTLFLYGTKSPSWMRDGVAAFHRAVPGSRIEPLEDQGHNAQFTTPEVLAAAINRFLAE